MRRDLSLDALRMRFLSTTEGFDAAVIDAAKAHGLTLSEAFLIVFEEHRQLFGWNKFASYQSWMNRRARRLRDRKGKPNTNG